MLIGPSENGLGVLSAGFMIGPSEVGLGVLSGGFMDGSSARRETGMSLSSGFKARTGCREERRRDMGLTNVLIWR